MHAPTPLAFDMVKAAEAAPDAKVLLDVAKSKMGMIPNMYGYMANFPALLDTYIHGYELFRGTSGFTPVEQEVVFLSISYENGCEYCMAAHSFVADRMSMVPHEVTEAIRAGKPIDDPRLRALSELARALVVDRGVAGPAVVQAFLDAGYTQAQFLAVILAVGVKTLSNYSNHALQTPLDEVFSNRAWAIPAAAD